MSLVRRLLAVCLLAVVLVVVWLAVVVPVRAIARSQTDWRWDVRRELARERGVAALEGSARKQLTALKDAAIWKRFYSTDVDGVLKQDVTTLATAAGGKITSLVTMPAQPSGHLRAYGIQLTTSLSIDQLKKFIVALRAEPKYLRVERLTISAPLSQPANANPPLVVKLEIFGYAAT